MAFCCARPAELVQHVALLWLRKEGRDPRCQFVAGVRGEASGALCGFLDLDVDAGGMFCGDPKNARQAELRRLVRVSTEQVVPAQLAYSRPLKLSKKWGQLLLQRTPASVPRDDPHGPRSGKVFGLPPASPGSRQSHGVLIRRRDDLNRSRLPIRVADVQIMHARTRSVVVLDEGNLQDLLQQGSYRFLLGAQGRHGLTVIPRGS
jgi:hypothetical protein